MTYVASEDIIEDGAVKYKKGDTISDYDPTKESCYIQYYDANNLYGWAMCQKLPTDGFRWMSNSELQ